jgi:hypothetical protein
VVDSPLNANLTHRYLHRAAYRIYPPVWHVSGMRDIGTEFELELERLRNMLLATKDEQMRIKLLDAIRETIARLRQESEPPI